VVKTREQTSRDCVVVGEVANSTPPTDACIPVDDLNKHTLVTGATGTGKTFTVATIVNRLAEGEYSVFFKPLILDWHGEYSSLLHDPEVKDPFHLPITLLSRDEEYYSVEFASQVLGLTPAQEYVLLKSLESLGGEENLNIADLVEILEGMADESAWFRESRLSLMRKLRRLTIGGYKELFSGGDLDLEVSSNKPLVIDLSKIGDLAIRRVYVAAFLKKIFDKALRGGFNSRRLLIVVEEARNLLGRDNYVEILVKMLDEIRKFGVGIVIVSQSPSALVEDVMANTSTKIVHSIKSAVDLEVLDKVVNMTSEIREILPYMDKGEAVLFSSFYKKPLLIRIV